MLNPFQFEINRQCLSLSKYQYTGFERVNQLLTLELIRRQVSYLSLRFVCLNLSNQKFPFLLKTLRVRFIF